MTDGQKAPEEFPKKTPEELDAKVIGYITRIDSRNVELQKTEDELIEQYFTKCDFNDECDFCHNDDQEQSYLCGDINEPEYYICRSCALKKIAKIQEREKSNKGGE